MDTAIDLQDRIEAIVKRGEAVRQEIASVTASSSRVVLAAAGDLTDVVRAVVRGATAASAAFVAEERGKTLREVVDGLGDGFATAAQAAELSIREARAKLVSFVAEDRERLATALESMSQQFVTHVADGAGAFVDQGLTQAGVLGDHASVTLQRIQPSLQAAVDAARQDPAALAKGVVGGAVAAVRGATGALFTAIGTKLAATGANITATDPNS